MKVCVGRRCEGEVYAAEAVAGLAAACSGEPLQSRHLVAV
jgi:hypothetical protein